MLLETTLSMLTNVCHLKHLFHRVGRYVRAHLAYLAALFNALLHWRAYAYETALHFYDHTLKLAEKTEIPERVETIVRLHCRRAEIFDRLGQREKQEIALQSATRWATQAGQSESLTVRNLWADFYIATGRYSQALAEAQAMMQDARFLGDQKIEARAYQQIGLACLNQGKYDKAIENFEAAAPLCEEIGRLDHLGLTLTNMGVAYSALGDHGRTLDLYQRAHELAVQTGDQLGQLGQASSEQVRSTLQAAHESLLQQAQTITDSVQREDFLAAPENRKILQAWEAVQQRSP